MENIQNKKVCIAVWMVTSIQDSYFVILGDCVEMVVVFDSVVLFLLILSYEKVDTFVLFFKWAKNLILDVLLCAEFEYAHKYSVLAIFELMQQK